MNPIQYEQWERHLAAINWPFPWERGGLKGPRAPADNTAIGGLPAEDLWRIKCIFEIASGIEFLEIRDF